MTRAALYFRQSLDVAEGIARQRDRCRLLAAAKGWEVVDEYVDNDTSATKERGEKTAWARLLDDARKGRFDVVVAVDLDRLLRTIRDLVTLTETGATVLTVDGEMDLTTADGEYRATQAAGLARFETRRKGERQRRANAAAAKDGRYVGGRRAFGYEPDGVTVREVEAVALGKGYVSFLSGVPLAEIARTWNAAGLTTGQGSPWAHYSVRQVLMNPRNMGMRAHLGEIVTEAKWPAIVEASTWQAVNAMLSNPDRRRQPTRGRYFLSGLAVCAVCRSTIHAGGNARSGIPAYRCSGSLGHFARKSGPVDAYVSAVVVERLSRPDARKLLSTNRTPDTAALHVEAVGVRERLEALAIDFADGSLTSAQLRAATGRLRGRLTEIDAKLADAGRVDVLGDIIGAANVGAVWEKYSIPRQRAIIDLLATVVVHAPGRGVRTFDPETVAIEWKV